MNKEEALAALDNLEEQIKSWMDTIRGDPSSAGHDREMDIAIQRMEESAMWIRRAVERKFG
jgi:hypothetical protein